jgi:glycosyltransferase involved in cell wall biosynthesis
MSHNPFFSVVVPTRNRAHLLQHALQSIQDQTLDDYELIVSDNCSDDGTEEVIRRWAPRATYIRPPQVLAMPDHWEFALEHARGRFVGYLCDDDVWAPSALERARQTISESDAKLVVLFSGLYHAPDWLQPDLRNVAMFRPNTRAVHEKQSSDTLRTLFQKCDVINEAPRMLNGFCERETLLRIRRAVGNKVFWLAPDYSFAAFVLSELPSWLFIDEPLHLQGVFPEGIGSTQFFNRGEPARQFEREFKHKLLQRVPLKNYVITNLIVETLLICQEMTPRLSEYEVDWVQYFTNNWNNILTLEGNGVNVEKDKEEFFRVLKLQPENVRQQVEALTDPARETSYDEWLRRHPLRASVRRAINGSPLLTNLESLVRRRGKNSDHTTAPQVKALSGEVAGFSNILECARRLPALAYEK